MCIVEIIKKKIIRICSSHMSFFVGSLSVKTEPCSFFYHSFIEHSATWFCELHCLHFIGNMCLNFRVFFVASYIKHCIYHLNVTAVISLIFKESDSLLRHNNRRLSYLCLPFESDAIITADKSLMSVNDMLRE